MCNDYRLEVDISTIAEDFEDLKIGIDFPEGVPNIEPRADIMITDPGPIVRASAGGGAELVQRRWSWPGTHREPVFNFRADEREFSSKRCLIVADGFYEFREPEDRSKKRKDKWLFTKVGEPIFCIAGIWRKHPEIGEAFTMLTLPPGPDMAPYHKRGVVVLDRAQWAAWLDPAISSKTLLRPVPAGRLHAEQVG